MSLQRNRVNYRDATGAQLYPNIPGSELQRDWYSTYVDIIGQDTPATSERWNMEHGRALGALETEGTYDPKYRDTALNQLETDDDCKGSGIFDEYGYPGTINQNMGIFADHPNLPGFVDREIPFVPNPEIKNLSTGAAIIGVPGGGMSYIDRGHDVMRNPCGPGLPCPQAVTDSVTSIMPQVPSEVSYSPVEHNPITNAGTYPASVQPQLPLFPQLPPASKSLPVTGIQRSYMTPMQPRPAFPNVTKRLAAIQTVMNPSAAIHGYPIVVPQAKRRSFGDDAQPAATPLSSYLIAGLMVGVGAAVLVSTLKGAK